MANLVACCPSCRGLYPESCLTCNGSGIVSLGPSPWPLSSLSSATEDENPGDFGAGLDVPESSDSEADYRRRAPMFM